jgi:aconitate hydratase
LVLAKSFARIHWDNLVNFGVLPLVLDNETEYDSIERGTALRIENLREQVRGGCDVEVRQESRILRSHHSLSKRQVEVLLAGGLINWAQA